MSDTKVSAKAGPGRIEFILLISLVMMITALAIDSMLPALPAIGNALGVTQENNRQFIVSAFFGGFGIMQLFIGTVTDRYGRRWLMLFGLIGFSVMSLAASYAKSFELLLFARAGQGMMAAIAQVVVRSAVRDRFVGREMAQVMSLAVAIFMAAPILAPALGQLVLTFGPWQWIFVGLAIVSFLTWGWVLLRLPESLPPSRRTPIQVDTITASIRTVLSDRMSLGYSVANALMSVSLIGYILSVQQIFEHSFGRPDLLPFGFALMASGIAAASLLNAMIVKRFGMRLIGHSALIFFLLIAVLHLAVTASGHETLLTFIALQMIMMLGFAFVVGNFGAMAMENMGEVAGMANSLQGSISNFAGLVFGTLIGQAFNGTTIPLYIGYSLCAAAALIAVLITERGHLFVARNAVVGG